MSAWFLAALLAHLIHEGAHFLAALLVGARRHALQLGFGKILSRREGRIELRVATVPIGLFYCFEQSPYAALAKWRRALVLLAGPLTSWLASFLVLLAALYGTSQAREARIAHVAEGSVAERAGIHDGDSIIEFGGRHVETFAELRDAVEAHPGGTVDIKLERGGSAFTVQAELDAGKLLGVRPATQELRGLEAIGAAARATYGFPVEDAANAIRMTRMLLFGRVPVRELAGPVMMYKQSGGDVGRLLIGAYSRLFAALSILFIVLPLLPIPRFDAARMLAVLRSH